MTPWAIHPAGALGPSDDLAVARAAVAGARAGGPQHEAARAQILAFVDGHPDALLRSCTEGHLTGSALVVDPSSRHVLLLFHTKVQRWLQPGGHADGDGEMAHVALREAEEETGIAGLAVVTPAIDLDVHVFRNAAGTEADHLHLDVRHLVLAPAGAEPTSNHESEGMAWVAVEDLDRYEVDDGTKRMAGAALAALTEIEAEGALQPGSSSGSGGGRAQKQVREPGGEAAEGAGGLPPQDGRRAAPPPGGR